VPPLSFVLEFPLPIFKSAMVFVIAIQAPGLDLDQLNHSRLKARDVPGHLLMFIRPLLMLSHPLFMFSRPRKPFFPLTVKRNFEVRLVLDNELDHSIQFFRCHMFLRWVCAKGEVSISRTTSRLAQFPRPDRSDEDGM